ncbi:MAG TPA: NAD(P)-dependent oxidoreductase [Solirubrobacteraceae bacterium]|nr:NAD(P)-dependent oxidoreductase [Solirubrobacteraceae bacterium]
MRIAFLGLGIMGSRMAANLLAAGHELTVWNRTAATAVAWAAEHPGAVVAASPAEAAAKAELVITMVVDGPDVEAVLLGPDGAAAAAAPGTLVADMSTIAPAAAEALQARLAERGLAFLDAPVTGSSPAAEAGTLTIMVGGDAADVARALPAFEAMGALVRHVGPCGHGQRVKLVNNAVAIANTITAGQALLAGKALGVDLDALVEVLSAGAAGSVVLDLKAGPMRTHEYPLLFKTEHMLKDVQHCLDAVGAEGVPFPAAADAREVLVATVGRGLGESDYAAVIEALEGLAGITLPDR